MQKHGDFHNQYKMSWTVQSYEPILEYRLFYRTIDINGIPDDKLPNLESNIIQPHYSSSYHSSMSTSSSNGNHAQWKDIVIIPQSFNQYTFNGGVEDEDTTQYHQYNRLLHHNANNINTRHHMSYLIENLRPACNYEVKVQARNLHGWSELSSSFNFSTQSDEATNEIIRSGGNFRPLTQRTSSATILKHYVVSLLTILHSTIFQLKFI